MDDTERWTFMIGVCTEIIVQCVRHITFLCEEIPTRIKYKSLASRSTKAEPRNLDSERTTIRACNVVLESALKC